MFESEKAFIVKINKIPFTKRSELLYKLSEKFCRLTVILRFFYISMPLYLRCIIGIPLLLCGFLTFASYLIFVIWGNWLDSHIRYCYSHKNFTFKNFFRINLRKLFLFVITATFITTYVHSQYEPICSIYGFLMCFIAAGYTIPLFDKIIYDIEET